MVSSDTLLELLNSLELSVIELSKQVIINQNLIREIKYQLYGENANNQFKKDEKRL